MTADLRAIIAAAALAVWSTSALAEPMHGIAMYGEPALPADFAHFPYANPNAPKGGTMVLGEVGGFDSLNPYILRGRAPWNLGPWTVETLLSRSIDEPFTLYGLLAESVETDEARTFVEFTLREEARFSDGSPVTIDDVIWSFETLAADGQPRYAGSWSKVADTIRTGPNSVRFVFTEPDRELPLVLGLRPVLKKAQWEGKDFTLSTMEPPIGSGPYTVAEVDAGRSVTYRRNPDWWGADLPVNVGLYNLDTLRTEFYGDNNVAFEAFKSGAVSVWREVNPAKWAVNFDFPAVRVGSVVLEEIAHRRPSGMEGLVMNTRRAVFDDWRVREAMILAFDFHLINQTITGGVEPRIESYFSNSDLGMTPGAAPQAVSDLLAPYRDTLPTGALDGYALPDQQNAGAQRRNLRRAAALLHEAGWRIEDGMLTREGRPFEFEILLQQGMDQPATIAQIYIQSLRRLGISAHITLVDSAQYKQRTTEFDFDMTHILRSFSLSPGTEQVLYWGSAGANQPGSRNLMGMMSPAADALIAAMLRAEEKDDFLAATQALDRVLMSGRFVVPFWFARTTRIAYRSDFHHPDTIPLYGDWPGFMPESWWYAP